MMEFDRSFDERVELGSDLVGDRDYVEADFHFSDSDGEESAGADPDCLKPIGELPMEPSPDSPKPPSHDIVVEAEPSLEPGEVTSISRVKDETGRWGVPQRVATWQPEASGSGYHIVNIGETVVGRGGYYGYRYPNSVHPTQIPVDLQADSKDTYMDRAVLVYNPRTKEGAMTSEHPHDTESDGADMARAALDAAESLRSASETVVYVFGAEADIDAGRGSVDGFLGHLSDQGLGQDRIVRGPTGKLRINFDLNAGNVTVVDLLTRDRTHIDLETGAIHLEPYEPYVEE